MAPQTWFIDRGGTQEPWPATESPTSKTQPYRLYRFLTDLEDLLNREPGDRQRLQALYPLVQRLLQSSEWLQLIPIAPDPKTGWAVEILYDEPDFPLTVQLVAWEPQRVSPIHNHGCWGLVALLQGQEKNQFWRRSPGDSSQLVETGSLVLNPGDLVCLMPDAIHRVKALGTTPTISFNVYGETDYDQRFEFDLDQGRATNF
ncbi:cysteine dioxygenase family protein [Picosynechococcus sp. PCC 8807]|uniref:cysteine dioxygenase family protein n=1 Tax=Picosynechococcus sp. PCC 8807 TaxID=195248 RepID=UPI0008109A80|nr:cupin [Picosynechococcus sp. PCC 8807]ANV92225.1 cupin [Picosynechococcus sp. PCC 8807]